MYSPRVERAVTTTLEAHGLSMRKAGWGFEATHAVSVAMIVHGFGFDEDTVVAALLHDTLEDTDLDPEEIRDRFGDLVLAIVRDVSEPPKPSAPWRERKLVYIGQVRDTPRAGARAVASADKIHNLSKMTEGLQAQGPTFVRPFTAPLEDLVWYQQAVFDALRGAWRHPVLEKHGRRLDAFMAVARHP